jgi:hypothetical protein
MASELSSRLRLIAVRQEMRHALGDRGGAVYIEVEIRIRSGRRHD